MNDPQKTLIRWEDTSSSSEGVALQETLTGMLAEDLDDSATLSVGEFIPLEISACVVEYRVELVAYQFVWREDSERFWVVDERLVDKVTNGFHAGLLCSFLHPEFSPIWDLEWLVSFICFSSLSEFLFCLDGNDALDGVCYISGLGEEFGWSVGEKPILKVGELVFASLCGH